MNASAVLRYALDVEAFSASDVMTETGLTRSTVLGLCDELAGRGWIQELDDSRAAGEYSKGRPARRYRLNARAGHIVGVDAGQHNISALITDLRGTPLSRVVLKLNDDRATARLTTTRAAIRTVVAEADASPDRVYVTVLGVPAPVDDQGRSPAGHEFWERMNPGFATAFPEYGHTVIENDANLAALAERARGAGRGSDSFAALLSGERFGAGLIVNDTLIRGRYGGAGELRLLGLVEGVGSTDGLGVLARKWAIEARRAGRIGGSSPLATIPDEAISASDVFAAAAAGDATALGIIDRLGRRLARVAEVLVSLLDIERVVVAGAIAPAIGPIIETARAALRGEPHAPLPEVVASELGGDAVLLGAVDHGLALVRANPLEFDAQSG